MRGPRASAAQILLLGLTMVACATDGEQLVEAVLVQGSPLRIDPLETGPAPGRPRPRLTHSQRENLPLAFPSGQQLISINANARGYCWPELIVVGRWTQRTLPGGKVQQGIMIDPVPIHPDGNTAMFGYVATSWLPFDDASASASRDWFHVASTHSRANERLVIELRSPIDLPAKPSLVLSNRRVDLPWAIEALGRATLTYLAQDASYILLAKERGRIPSRNALYLEVEEVLRSPRGQTVPPRIIVEWPACDSVLDHHATTISAAPVRLYLLQGPELNSSLEMTLWDRLDKKTLAQLGDSYAPLGGTLLVRLPAELTGAVREAMSKRLMHPVAWEREFGDSPARSPRLEVIYDGHPARALEMMRSRLGRLRLFGERSLQLRPYLPRCTLIREIAHRLFATRESFANEYTYLSSLIAVLGELEAERHTGAVERLVDALLAQLDAHPEPPVSPLPPVRLLPMDFERAWLPPETMEERFMDDTNHALTWLLTALPAERARARYAARLRGLYGSTLPARWRLEVATALSAIVPGTFGPAPIARIDVRSGRCFRGGEWRYW